MSTLVERIEVAAQQTSTPSLAWLGQAGLLLRTGTGTTVLIDPYLSDECERLFGHRRMVPAPLSTAEIAPEAVLITHWHDDHLDVPTVLAFASSGSLVVGPPSVQARVTGLGVPTEQTRTLNRGEKVAIQDIAVTATFARHDVPGFLAEDAVGFVLDIDGRKIYNVGDSDYDHRLLAAGRDFDLCVVPINGTGGNMDVYEAAFLAVRLGCRSTMPVHFGMWPPARYGEGATLDPAEFEAIYASYGGIGLVLVPHLGEVIAVERGGAKVRDG